jgi:hypothetical protein
VSLISSAQVLAVCTTIESKDSVLAPTWRYRRPLAFRMGVCVGRTQTSGFGPYREGIASHLPCGKAWYAVHAGFATSSQSSLRGFPLVSCVALQLSCDWTMMRRGDGAEQR